ncbi:fungal pheromone STE3G-protein-coupled receptor, partial [Nadsonia fulvescens var. elongata DSM 6958]
MTLKATLQVLSMIAVIVPIAPTVWHIKCNNWPAVCLLVYLYILNLNTFIGATIWSRNLDQGFQGHIYCDIMVHFLCAASLGVVCPIVAILRNLCAIMSKQGPSSTFEENASGKTVLNKKKLFIDLAISLGFPIYSMSVLYIVQPSRYSLSEINGCIYFVSSSWVSLVLLFIWPPIISLIGTGYAIVIIFRYMQRRRDFKDLLHCSGSGLTTTRFARLVIFSSVVIAIMLPITLSVLILNLSNGLKSFVWDEVHIDSMWSKVQYFARTKVYFDRWIFITIAFLSFIFFGTGSDALSMYYHWLEVLGL